MKLTQIRYALAVAKELNFSRAAERCHVSQPALSVAIKQLETELGTALFERVNNEVHVTEAGEALLSQMEKASEELELVHSIADSLGDGLDGTLRLAAIYSVGPYLFPNLVPRLHDLAPNLNLIIEENFTAVLSERLKHGDVDAIIIALPFESHGVDVTPIYDEPFVAALPKSFGANDNSSVAAADLAKEQMLLLGKGHCFRDQVLDICRGADNGPSQEGANGSQFDVIESNSLETIRHMVAAGTGVSILPVTSVNSYVCSATSCPERSNQLVQYLPLADQEPFRRIAIAWRQSYPNRRVIEVVEEALCSAPPNGVEIVTKDRLELTPVGWGANSLCL